MNRTLLASIAPLIVVLAAGGPLDSRATLIVNSGFESGTGPDADNWNEIEVAGGTMGATSIADRDGSTPNTGAFAMFLDVVGAADFGPVAEIQQQTAVGSVAPGMSYDFNFLAQGVAGPGSVGFYEVIWFDGDGSSGGGPQGSATGLQTFPLGAAYAPVGMAGLVAPATADSALVQIRLVTGAFVGASGTAYIDDVTFAAIPEPGTALLLGVGIVVLAAYRRRASRTP